MSPSELPESAGTEQLFPRVYAELKRLAAARMGGQEPGHTLQPTALVNEAFLRLQGSAPGEQSYRDQGHFFAAAAAAMRSILVDHARAKNAVKRAGAGLRLTLHPDLVGEAEPEERVLAVNEVIDRLSEEHPRVAEVVQLLFFTGLSVAESAAVLEISDRTVKRDWRFGRAWLMREIGEP